MVRALAHRWRAGGAGHRAGGAAACPLARRISRRPGAARVLRRDPAELGRVAYPAWPAAAVRGGLLRAWLFLHYRPSAAAPGRAWLGDLGVLPRSTPLRENRRHDRADPGRWHDHHHRWVPVRAAGDEP